MSSKRTRSFILIGTFFLIISIGAVIIATTIFLNIDSSKWVSDNTSSTIQGDAKDIGNYKLIQMSEQDIHKGELILVNRDNAYTFDEELDLVSLMGQKTDSYLIKDKNVLVKESIIPQLNAMLDDFNRHTNLKTINVISGHRTYDYQQNLLNERISRDGEEQALNYVAKPGSSEHHTGMAVDFGLVLGNGVYKDYDGTGDYAYLNENCYKYGFIVRYADAKKDLTGIYYEPWHFRYVGIPHSYIINNNGFCFEEYIDFLKQYTFDSEHLIFNIDDSEYEIYYVNGLDVYVPTDKEYTVSGNNIDGFIVTVKVK